MLPTPLLAVPALLLPGPLAAPQRCCKGGGARDRGGGCYNSWQRSFVPKQNRIQVSPGQCWQGAGRVCYGQGQVANPVRSWSCFMRLLRLLCPPAAIAYGPVSPSCFLGFFSSVFFCFSPITLSQAAGHRARVNPLCYLRTHRAGHDQGHAGQRAVGSGRAGVEHHVGESHLAAVLQCDLCFGDFVKQLKGGQRSGGVEDSALRPGTSSHVRWDESKRTQGGEKQGQRSSGHLAWEPPGYLSAPHRDRYFWQHAEGQCQPHQDQL